MMFNKELAPKPILFKKEICKLLHIPYKAHYKCFIKKKYSSLSWNDKRKIKEYIYSAQAPRYRAYYMSQWELMHYLCKYYIEKNSVNISKETLDENLNYDQNQIYLKIDFDAQPLVLAI